MQQSKATETPQELFQNIILQAFLEFGGYNVSERRGLSNIAAVCRYWARMSRPRLFKYIYLATADAAKRFIKVLNGPALHDLNSAALLVRELDAYFDIMDEPWLHLVFSQIIPKLPFATFSVEPKDLGTITFRTLHSSLPRTIPGPRARSCKSLFLAGGHIPKSRTLSSLLSSLPTLKELWATDLTFGTNPTPEDFLRIPIHQELVRLRTNNRHLCLSFLPLLVANISIGESATNAPSRRRPSSIINEDNLKVLLDLLGIFHSEVDTTFDITREDDCEFWFAFKLNCIRDSPDCAPLSRHSDRIL